MPRITGTKQLSLPIFEDVPEANSAMWMSFSAVSPAPIFHWRETALDWKARILVYGGSSTVLLAKLDPAQLCWKMLQQLLMRDAAGQKLLRRLPDWGTAHNGALYRLVMPERHTSATDGFVWATPTAHDYLNRQPPTSDRLHITSSGTLKLDTGAMSHVNLAQSVQYYEQKQDWHTPIANDSRKTGAIEQKRENGLSAQVQWATPTVNTSKNNGSTSQWKRNSKPLDAQVKESPNQAGYLNPEWVEMLQGFPKNWTEID